MTTGSPVLIQVRGCGEGTSCPVNGTRRRARWPVAAGTSGSAARGRGVGHLLGAPGAHDLAVTVDPRCVGQARNGRVTVEGQLGLVSSHLDPDGFAAVQLVLDRVQLDDPDRTAIGRRSVRALDLLALGQPGHTEPDPA